MTNMSHYIKLSKSWVQHGLNCKTKNLIKKSHRLVKRAP